LEQPKFLIERLFSLWLRFQPLNGIAMKYIKHLRASASIASVCLLASWLYAPAHAAPIGPTLHKDVEFELKPSTPDDELIAVAEAADINIVADATDLPTQSSLVETPWHGKLPWKLWNLVKEITAGRMMAWDPQPDDKTFLFWKQPSTETLRAALQQPQVVTSITSQADDLSIRRRLSEYLRDRHGWDGAKPNFAVSVPLSQLPEDLQREMIAAAQKAPALLPTGFLQAITNKDSWQTARLKLVMPKNRSRQPIDAQYPQLVLSFSQGGSTVGTVLTELKPRQ